MKNLKPFDPERKPLASEREEASKNYEEHLRQTTKFSERQIEQTVNDHRKMIGLPSKQIASEIQQVRDWISNVQGVFTNRQLMDELAIPSSRKAQISTNLVRLVDEGLLIRVGGKYGQWRAIDDKLERISLKARIRHFVDLKLPFGLNSMVRISPGNLIVVAGTTNAGKTALLLNLVADNMYKFKCHYFTSELGQAELTDRLADFDDIPWEDWDNHLDAFPRVYDFADVVRPGAGNVNFIDYVEISEDFYRIGGILTEIYSRLDGALAVIALQKNPGVQVARGGYGTMEKPRLYLSMEYNKLKILKAKNWKGKVNPNGLELGFKLLKGVKFEQTSGWMRPT